MSTEDQNKAVVTLKKGVDVDAFIEDMVSGKNHSEFMPGRRVELFDEKPGSKRNVDFVLTREEANNLKNDPRIVDVRYGTKIENGIILSSSAIDPGGDQLYSKTSDLTATHRNWGIPACITTTNPFITTELEFTHTYPLAGKGVDVVIMDSGILLNHPEWISPTTGLTRVSQLNWPNSSGLSGTYTQSPNHYTDTDGHGTHIAGTVAGRLYGWAKEANIHAMTIIDNAAAFGISAGFNMIRGWHNLKPTGNPTVVNMSWGYGTFYNTVTSLTYRGTTYSDASTTGNASYRFSNYGLNSSSGSPFATYIANVRIASVDTDIEEMIDAGIVVCIAAGNRGTKIDVFGGLDYNNYVTTNAGIKYYHRGSSPYSDRALMVGSIDSTVYDINNDQKATYSETGPGVSIWAPGTNIMSACSNTNAFGGQSYYLNASFKQVNISGTSMAAPQVAGVAALALQLNPTYTPTQVKSSLVENASDDIYTTGNTTDYSNTRSLLGSGIKMLYSSFTQAPISGGPVALVVKGGGLRITADIRMV